MKLRHQPEMKPSQQTAPPRDKPIKTKSTLHWNAVQMYVLHPHAKTSHAPPDPAVHGQRHAHVQALGPGLAARVLCGTLLFHPAGRRVVSPRCLLFSDGLPPAPPLSQKTRFPAQFPSAGEKKNRRRADTACRSIGARVNVRACVHVEVNTSNLALKECSVFCSRPSLLRVARQQQMFVLASRLPKCGGCGGGGGTRRSAAT